MFAFLVTPLGKQSNQSFHKTSFVVLNEKIFLDDIIIVLCQLENNIIGKGSFVWFSEEPEDL